MNTTLAVHLHIMKSTKARTVSRAVMTASPVKTVAAREAGESRVEKSVRSP